MLGAIHKGRPLEGEGGWQMRMPALILPVKGQILRTWGEGGKKWQNFADVLYGWSPTVLIMRQNFVDLFNTRFKKNPVPLTAAYYRGLTVSFFNE